MTKGEWSTYDVAMTSSMGCHDCYIAVLSVLWDLSFLPLLSSWLILNIIILIVLNIIILSSFIDIMVTLIMIIMTIILIILIRLIILIILILFATSVAGAHVSSFTFDQIKHLPSFPSLVRGAASAIAVGPTHVWSPGKVDGWTDGIHPPYANGATCPTPL